MQRNHLKTPRLCLTLALAVYLCLGALPATQGFIAGDHRIPDHLKRKLNNLIRRVHKEQWVIGYVYMDNCAPSSRNNGKAIEEAITQSLNAWLKPVRDLNTGKPVVDDFRYEHKLEIPVEADFKLYDLRIYFYCDFAKSHASVIANEAHPPALLMHSGIEVNEFAGILLHEMGHAFGLLDTYIRPHLTLEELRVSRGGLVTTIGHQPASVMSGLNFPPPWPTRISQDDANGIVWLYKFYHENLPLEDCIFPDYELEKSPDGCRPKYPLIFEIKHGDERIAGDVIYNNNENIDINAKDGNGMTALHYAVIKGYPKLVDRLLSREGIEVNAKDETGATALDYALEKGYNRLVDRLTSHPDFDVNAIKVGGNTALFRAAKRGYYGLTEQLLEHRAIDVNIRNTDGTTPLKVASTEGHNSIVWLLLNQKQDVTDWTRVTQDAPSHHRSVFYLLHQPVSNSPQIFHLGYLGTLPDGAALFAAHRTGEDSIEKYLNEGDFSLVGYQGLVSAGLKVRTVASFAGRNGKTGSTLLSVRGVDLSAYELLGLAVYPTLTETEVEVLTYKFGAGIWLGGGDADKALNLPLQSRACTSIPHVQLAGMDVGQHTCGPPNSVAVGSLLFDKENQTLIGFYRLQGGASTHVKSILGDGLPLADSVSEQLIRLVDAKSVRPKNKLATLWGALKAR